MNSINNNQDAMFQVSTLQALAMGYTRTVITVEELIAHGDTGLGTYEDVNGEMILLDGHPYRADESGAIEEVSGETGVPFSAVAFVRGIRKFDITDGDQISDIDSLKKLLNVKIEEDFGLNSMHMVRIDGFFEKVLARSEAPYRSQHVTLKEVLSKTQKDFAFSDIAGSLVCVYFPDYMDGINAPGWHLHFVSEDRTKGGHVFDLSMKEGTVLLDKISRIEIQLPREAAFDTYALKEASQDEIKEVEQGK